MPPVRVFQAHPSDQVTQPRSIFGRLPYSMISSDNQCKPSAQKSGSEPQRIKAGDPLRAKKNPGRTGVFHESATLSLVMHKQRQQDDDWKWDSNQPKECTFTKAHVCLHTSVASQRRDPTTVPRSRRDNATRGDRNIVGGARVVELSNPPKENNMRNFVAIAATAALF
jgi:hypothetical protein